MKKLLLLLALGSGCSAPAEMADMQQAATVVPQVCAYFGDAKKCSVRPADAVAAIMAHIAGVPHADTSFVVRLDVTVGRESISPDTARAWAAQMKDTVAALRAAGATAATVSDTIASMKNVIEQQIDANKRSVAPSSQKRRKLAEALESRVLQAGSAARGEAAMQLAVTRQAAQRVREALDMYSATLSEERPRYERALLELQAGRMADATVQATLETFSRRASAATSQLELATVEQELIDYSRRETRAAATLAIDARRIAGALASAQRQCDDTLAAEQAFVASHGIVRPSSALEPSRVATEIAAFADARDERIRTVVGTLLEGIRIRRAALIASAAELASRETLAQSASLAATNRYAIEISAEAEPLWRASPRSNRLQLSFLAGRYDELSSFLQLESACHVAGRAKWMDDGCIIAAREAARIREFLRTTLPGTIRIGLSIMQRAGVEAALINAASSALASGDLAGAVERHDTALRASENLE